jgi:hypothetical protein
MHPTSKTAFPKLLCNHSSCHSYFWHPVTTAEWLGLCCVCMFGVREPSIYVAYVCLVSGSHPSMLRMYVWCQGAIHLCCVCMFGVREPSIYVVYVCLVTGSHPSMLCMYVWCQGAIHRGDWYRTKDLIAQGSDWIIKQVKMSKIWEWLSNALSC